MSLPRRHQDGVKFTRHPLQAVPLCVLGFTPLPPEARTSRARGELGYHLPWYRGGDLKDSSADPSPRFWPDLGGPTFQRCGEADSLGRSKPACGGCFPQSLGSALASVPSHDGAPALYRDSHATFQPLPLALDPLQAPPSSPGPVSFQGPTFGAPHCHPKPI